MVWPPYYAWRRHDYRRHFPVLLHRRLPVGAPRHRGYGMEIRQRKRRDRSPRSLVAELSAQREISLDVCGGKAIASAGRLKTGLYQLMQAVRKQIEFGNSIMQRCCSLSSSR